MPIEIPDLWGDDIKVDVLPPLIILKAQDEAISRKTKGILRTEVSTTEVHEKSEDEEPPAVTTHVLDLVAPALGYSESLLEVSHDSDRLYPATLTVPDPIRWDLANDPLPSRGLPDLNEMLKSTQTVKAYSAEELLKYLRRALQSRDTKAAIDSLLARSNEAQLKRRASPVDGS